MLNITIIAVGALKEAHFTDACAEYKKRLNSFCKLRIIEIGEYRLGQNPSAAEIEKCLLSEGVDILSKLPPRAYTVALCIEGKLMASAGLAAKIEKISESASHIAFVIGSSHGLSEVVKQRAELKLSMSEMTFPHQLARVMLLEQLYRAFSITGGMKYHK